MPGLLFHTFREDKLLSSFTDPHREKYFASDGLYPETHAQIISMMRFRTFELMRFWTWIDAMCLVTQSCLTLCDTVDCSLPGSLGILQARILEWVAMPSSRGSSQPRDWTQVSCNCRRSLYWLSPQGRPRILEWITYPFSRDLPNWGIELGSPTLQADSLPAEVPGKPYRYYKRAESIGALMFVSSPSLTLTSLPSCLFY